MAIFHDAYLFKEQRFATSVTPYLDALRVQEVYHLLRSKVIDLFEDSSHVRKLADEYGAWDRDGIMTLTPAEFPYTEQDIGFLIVFLLYDHLFTSNDDRLGLGHHRELMRKTARALGWSDRESNLLVEGRSFRHFAQKWYGKSDSRNLEEHLHYWNYVCPGSTAGRVGWLDSGNVEKLLSRLVKDQSRLSGLQLQEDEQLVQQTYQHAKRMLISAKKTQSALCIIISG